MYSKSKKAKFSTMITFKRVVILLALLLFGVALLFGAYKLGERGSNQSVETEDEVVQPVNLDPPREEDLVSDEDKQNIDDNNSQSPPVNDPEKTSANVVITDASQYGDIVEVRAFIPSIIQEGQCAITFTQGSETLSKQVPAYSDASTTICTNLSVPLGEFTTNGIWSVSVIYESGTHRGVSASQNLEINK
jgi:hypothetical protein